MTGVLFFTSGGPRTREEIPAFLMRYLGREVPPPVLGAIVERYDLIGGFSPLDELTERQAAALEARLGGGFVCRAGFRHSEPSMARQLAALREAGTERLVLLAASPFFTSVTTGDQLAHARSALGASGWGVDALFVHSWFAEPAFLDAWADVIAEGGAGADAGYVFSAHSLPLRLTGEAYAGQVEAAADAIGKRLDAACWTVGWQSVPPNAREPWQGPPVEEVLDTFAREGVRSVVEVPLGFTADHVETLYDIDIVHRRHAEGLGLSWRRARSLNDDPRFIAALARVVQAALASPERFRP
ncbi:MAG: ferrochelatase [Deltaproteobacteria bacterium]|nr:ferrochelatase [Deltaproteobacteria bacterium]